MNVSIKFLAKVTIIIATFFLIVTILIVYKINLESNANRNFKTKNSEYNRFQKIYLNKKNDTNNNIQYKTIENENEQLKCRSGSKFNIKLKDKSKTAKSTAADLKEDGPDIENQQLAKPNDLKSQSIEPKQELELFQKAQKSSINSENVCSKINAINNIVLGDEFDVYNQATGDSMIKTPYIKENVIFPATIVHEPLCHKKDVFLDDSLRKATGSINILNKDLEALNTEKTLRFEPRILQDDDSYTKNCYDFEAKFEKLSVKALKEFEFELSGLEMSKSDHDQTKEQQNETQIKKIKTEIFENADQNLPYSNKQISDKEEDKSIHDFDISKVHSRNFIVQNTNFSEDFDRITQEAVPKLNKKNFIKELDVKIGPLENIKLEEKVQSEEKHNNAEFCDSNIKVHNEKSGSNDCFDGLLSITNNPLFDFKNQNNKKSTETEDNKKNRDDQILDDINNPESQISQKNIINKIPDTQNANFLSISDQDNTIIENSELGKVRNMIDYLNNNSLLPKQEIVKKLSERNEEKPQYKKTVKKDFRNHTYVNFDYKNQTSIESVDNVEEKLRSKDGSLELKVEKELSLKSNHIKNVEISGSSKKHDKNLHEPKIKKLESLESNHIKLDENIIKNNEKEKILRLCFKKDNNIHFTDHIDENNKSNFKNDGFLEFKKKKKI
ncbi:hypothetical protein GVAV_001527 [Gurleya vavrai]